jgi:chloramphenicol O-acetyltransferase type B
MFHPMPLWVEYLPKLLSIAFSEADIEKLLALKLYDLDEKQFLKMREQLQTR